MFAPGHVWTFGDAVGKVRYGAHGRHRSATLQAWRGRSYEYTDYLASGKKSCSPPTRNEAMAR